jgi:tetratricopeptide (TPR) repeat protein
MCFIYYWQGNIKMLLKGGNRLLDYGEKTSNSRRKVFGYWMNAMGHYLEGDMALSIRESQKAIEASLDPFYSQFAKPGLGISYFLDGQLEKAEATFKSLLDFCEKRGIGVLSEFATTGLSTILIAKGNVIQGFKKFGEAQKVMQKNRMKVFYAVSDYMLGVIYTQFVTRPSPDFSTLVKNIGSIAKIAPFAYKRAEEHFNKAIATFRETGAKMNLGQAFLGLGQLYETKKRSEKSRECFSEAAHFFKECDAHVFLKQAQDKLASVVK